MNYKLERKSEYINDGSMTLNWYVYVKFDNGDVLKIIFDDLNKINVVIAAPIREYELKKRNEKITKILNRNKKIIYENI